MQCLEITQDHKNNYQYQMLRNLLVKYLTLYFNRILVKIGKKSNLTTTPNNFNHICIKFKLNKICIASFRSVHLIPHAPLFLIFTKFYEAGKILTLILKVCDI